MEAQHPLGQPPAFDRPLPEPPAQNAARWIEYPTARLAQESRDWALPLVLRPLLLGSISVAVLLVARRVRARRARVATLRIASPIA